MAVDYKQVLELAKSGKWDQAHQMIQPYSDTMSCLIHAYLHRVEGDTGNARYWYNRADASMPENSLEEEFDRLYQQLESGKQQRQSSQTK